MNLIEILKAIYDLTDKAKRLNDEEARDFNVKCIAALSNILLHPNEPEHKERFLEYLTDLDELHKKGMFQDLGAADWLKRLEKLFTEPTPNIYTAFSVQQLFDKVNDLRVKQNSPLGFAADAMKFNEEVGELNRLSSINSGMQSNNFDTEQFKKEYAHESADVIQNLFLLCQRNDLTWDDIANAFVEKNEKWERLITSGQYRERYLSLTPVGCNLNKPVYTVKHSQLQTPEGDESIFRKICPVCEYGLLLVHRSQTAPYHVLGRDNCVYCGQNFFYSDVDKIESSKV